MLVTRLNNCFNRIFEGDFTVSGQGSMETEMPHRPANVLFANTLEEGIAPFAQLLYALEMDSPAKFEEYSRHPRRTYDIFLERYLGLPRPTLPARCRVSARTSPKPSVGAWLLTRA